MTTEKYIPLHILEEITNGFSVDAIIGRGGYGDVYKVWFDTIPGQTSGRAGLRAGPSQARHKKLRPGPGPARPSGLCFWARARPEHVKARRALGRPGPTFRKWQKRRARARPGPAFGLKN